MKTRNFFSYIMWGIFAVLLSALYYFSALEFLNSLNLLEYKYNVIIVIVTGIVLAVLVFIFDKLLKKGQLSSGDKKYEFYGIIGYIIALISFLAYRIWNSASTIQKIASSNVVNSLHKQSIIGGNGTIYLNASSVSAMFNSIVSVSFKFLGNNAIGIYIAEFAIGFLCFVFTFYGIKAIYGRMEAFFVAIGTAFLPAFAIHNRDYSVYIMEYLVFSIALYFISIAKRMLKTKYGSEIGIILASAIVGLSYLYDNIAIGLIILLIVLIIESGNLSVVRKITGIFACLITFVLSIIIPLVVGAYYDSKVTSIDKYLMDFAKYRISGSFNYNHLFEFARTNFVLIVIIACIAYVVMFLRCKFDEAHSMIMFFIIMLTAMCFFAGDDIITYSLVLIMCLLVIAGAGIKKLIGFKDEDTIDTEPTPEPRKKYDEQDPDIEILDEGTTDSEEENCPEEEESTEVPDKEEAEPAEEPVTVPNEEPAEEPVTEGEPDPDNNPDEEPAEGPDTEGEPEPDNNPDEEPAEGPDTEDEPKTDDNPGEKPAVEPSTEPETESVRKGTVVPNETNIHKKKSVPSTDLFITPLPMPKKGVKKEVKFDFDVPDNLMHFDIELDDSNYFYDVV